jgi:hypothetical protein
LSRQLVDIRDCQNLRGSRSLVGRR